MMNKSIKKRIYFVVAVFITALGSLFFMNFDDDRNFEIAKQLDIFYSLFKEVNQTYVDQVDPADLMNVAIKAMLESLDPYTVFIPEADVERYTILTKGEYGGIGAMIGPKDSIMLVSKIMKGFAADKAGLLPGDRIVEIDGRSIKGISNDDIHELLKGQPGSVLKLGILRGASTEIIHFSITREKIQLKSVPYYGLYKDSIGYIKLSQFTQNCSGEVRIAYLDLQKQGAKYFILDLRDNPGGLLFEAVELSNLFIDKGKKVVFTKGKNVLAENTYVTMNPPMDTKTPLIVLVNDRSASASEIVAGTLQDYDRAVVIGNQTFGKGLVQTRKELAHNTLLKITNSKYYIPSGRCIQKIDYSHKDAQGKPVSYSNSNLTTFYTQNKRPVTDAGGIIPDVLIDKKQDVEVLQVLDNDYVYIDFISRNFKQIDSLLYTPYSIVISDKLFNDFVDFVIQNKIYTSSTAKKLQEIKELSAKEGYSFGTYYTEMESTLNSSQRKVFMSYKDLIIEKLSAEIVEFYYYESGRYEFLIKNDVYILKAFEYVVDNSLYSNVLLGVIGEHKK